MPGSRWLGTSEKEREWDKKRVRTKGLPCCFSRFFSLSPTTDREPGTVIWLNFLSPDNVILEDRQSFATNLMRASPTQINTWLSVNKLSAAGSFREYWMQMNCFVLPFYLVLFILQSSIVCCLFCPILLYFERGTVLDSWFKRLFHSFSLTAVSLSVIGYCERFSCQKKPLGTQIFTLDNGTLQKKHTTKICEL